MRWIVEAYDERLDMPIIDIKAILKKNKAI